MTLFCTTPMTGLRILADEDVKKLPAPQQGRRAAGLIRVSNPCTFYASSAASAQIYATAERILSRASDLCRAFPFFTLHLERLLRLGDNVSGEKAYSDIP